MLNQEVAKAGALFVPNLEQKQVIDAAPDARLLVVAGPGTGKTQVAAMRLVNLLVAGFQPAQILVLSFSRSAVATLTKRVVSLEVGEDGIVEDLRHLAVRTFDSWAFRLLRQHGASVTDLMSNSHDENIGLATRAIADASDAEFAERFASIRHVIVDEFQDLPGVRSEMVIELLARLTSDPHRQVGFHGARRSRAGHLQVRRPKRWGHRGHPGSLGCPQGADRHGPARGLAPKEPPKYRSARRDRSEHAQDSSQHGSGSTSQAGRNAEVYGEAAIYRTRDEDRSGASRADA